MTGHVVRDPHAEFERRATNEFTANSPATAVSIDTPVDQTGAEELPLVLDPSDPLGNARRFVADAFTRDDRRILHHHRDEFFAWAHSRYRRVDEADLRARLYGYLEGAQVKDRDGLRPFKPTTQRVSETLDALRAAPPRRAKSRRRVVGASLRLATDRDRSLLQRIASPSRDAATRP